MKFRPEYHMTIDNGPGAKVDMYYLYSEGDFGMNVSIGVSAGIKGKKVVDTICKLWNEANDPDGI